MSTTLVRLGGGVLERVKTDNSLIRRFPSDIEGHPARAPRHDIDAGLTGHVLAG